MTCFKNDFFITTLQNVPKIEIMENVVDATLKVPDTTCGDWRQGWTTLS
jgi:hypothetical protein